MLYETLFLDASAAACTACWWKLLALFLGALLLGLLLGYILWHRFKALVDGLRAEKEQLNGSIIDLKTEIDTLKYQYDEASKENSSLKSSLGRCEADKAVLEAKLAKCEASLAAGGGDAGASGIVAAAGMSGAAKAETKAEGYASVFASDNLQIIEGIGPKIEQLLKDAGIRTWGDLASADLGRLQKILDDAGPRYRMHNPKSWSEQARMAHEGKWEELIHYQKFLDAGREDQGDFETPSKVEKMYIKAIGFAAAKETDLKVIEGIGPKIEQLLKADGINTWADLAKASVERLQGILDKAGEHYRLADPGTWPQQAGLAAAGKWGELKAYQDQLKGGK